MEQEAALLEGAGHWVEQYVLPPAEELHLSAPAAALAATWNRHACEELGQRIEEFRPDVVHIHNPFPLLSPAVVDVVRRYQRVAAIMTFHNFVPSCIAYTLSRKGQVCTKCLGSATKFPGIFYRCYRGSYAASAALTASVVIHRARRTFSKLHRVIALSDFSRDVLVQERIDPQKVVVKPNHIDDPGATRLSGQLGTHAFFAGRLVDVKGVRTLLDAWRVLGSELPLRIAGDGPLRSLVETEAERNRSVTYLGWLSRTKVGRELVNAKLAVVPSQSYESATPLVLIEALAHACPAVVSDLGNLKVPAVPSGAAVSFAAGNTDSLIATVKQIASDQKRLDEVSLAARRLYSERYTPEQSLRTLLKIYDLAVSEARSEAQPQERIDN